VIFLVTGGAGFIGSALIRELLKSKKNTVINIDNLSYSGNLESIPLSNQYSNYIFEHCDILNKDELERIFNQYEPNRIFHLAAETHVDRSIQSPKIFLETNIIGTFNLLEESRKIIEKKQLSASFDFIFHHISTDEVYGDLSPTATKFTEENPYMPSSPYAASKASSDYLVRAWGRTYNVPYVVTNCSNNYGPYQFPEKLIPHTIISALSGNTIPIYGDGSQTRDWLYVNDHIQALLLISKESMSHTSYNIGGNSEVKNLDVVKFICSYLDSKISNKPIGISSFHELITFVEDRPGHDKRYAVSSKKIKTELNWSPKEDFKSGLKNTIDWYLKNRDWWEQIISGEYELKRIGLINEEK
tara:strand:- start:1881 stop:2954 length:1074 start_codon:yes stop_codon:yes gene_type:complete